jgi:HK97 family phage major capsid protein
VEHEIRNVRDAIKVAERQHADARATADKVGAEMRDAGVDFAKDADAFQRLDDAYKAADAARDEVADLRAREVRLMEIVGERVAERKDSAERREAVGIAEAFLRSGEYATLRDSRALDMDAARVQTAPVEVAGRDALVDALRLRTTLDNSAGSGGGRIWSDRREGLLVESPVRNVRLLDVITVGTTDSDTIEWAQETTVTDAAAETAYGTAVPEAAYGYTKTSTSVKRIGHFVPATKGALADGGQLRTLIESRLMRGVYFRLESQALAGDGTGQNLTGILSTAGIGSQALGSDTRFDAVHKAITNVRVNAYAEPTVIGMSPADFEKVLLEKDSSGNYVHGRAASEGTLQTLWGLVPVVSTLFTTGTPVVGNYADAVMWMRSGVSIAASDSHSDYFTKGLVAILAETRAAFAVLQPKSFCKITGF